ncbi:MAG TPA: AAA family ATPase, partial [Tepidisphaeraceae bacterium]|nr:AAA family ATPase [Tepidisphaeraceae bacterium]
MRLRKLILQGFKSFADRTEFAFDCPVTGVVGPNGCGKSNVVDAVKWVLGEQSAKSLRGEAMMDVIFNGSGARKPAGMAEVTLVFDNPKRPDGTRVLNLDADEVAVGRRLFRDGTSEYQLNNQASRLKDIRELFLDTGVGVDAYSMIEQGRVAMLLESNPQERRLIFEEAAGISKFKARKKETQRKLERVDQNLLRVTDIVEEVDKRLRSVRIQAGRARTYQEHSQRLRELRLTYALQEYHTLHQQLEERQKNEAQTKAQLEEIATELSEKQLALGEVKQAYDSASQQKQRTEYELVQTKAAMQAAIQRQGYAQQQLKQIAEQLAQFEEDHSNLVEKSEQVDASLATEEQTLKRLTDEVSEHRRQIEERQQIFHDTQLELNQINREIEQHKAAILDLMRRSASVNNRLGAIEIERKNIASQQQRLGQRRQVVLSELEVLEAGRKELDENLAAVTEEIHTLQAQLEDSAHQASALGKQIAQITEQLGSAREQRSGLLSRQKLLQDLETKREGISEGVKAVLRQRQEKYPFIRGLVADLLRVDVEHAKAIEAALDGRDQMLIADDHAAVLAARELLQKLEGRVNILCTDQLPTAQNTADDSTPDLSLVDDPDLTLDWSLPFTLTAPQSLPSAWTETLTLGDPDLPTWNELDDFASAAELTPSYGYPAWALATLSASDELAEPWPTDLTFASPDAQPRSSTAYDWTRHPQTIRLASDLVIVEPQDAAIAQYFLGQTALVDSLDDARELHHTGPAGWRYVTKDGAVLEADGTLRVGPLTAAMGLISRRSELDALKVQLADVDARITQLSDQLAQGNAQVKALQEQQNTLRNAMYQANTKKVQTTSRIAQNTDKQSSFRRELPVLEKELQAFLDQYGRLKTEEDSLIEKRQAIETEQAERQKQIQQLTAQQAAGTEAVKQHGEALTALRVQLGQVQEKQIASQQAVQRLKATKNELAEQIARIARTAEQVAARRGSVEKELAAAKQAETDLTQKQKELAEAIQELAQQVAELKEKVQML